jgi:hypothetical protein
VLKYVYMHTYIYAYIHIDVHILTYVRTYYINRLLRFTNVFVFAVDESKSRGGIGGECMY